MRCITILPLRRDSPEANIKHLMILVLALGVSGCLAELGVKLAYQLGSEIGGGLIGNILAARKEEEKK